MKHWSEKVWKFIQKGSKIANKFSKISMTLSKLVNIVKFKL